MLVLTINEKDLIKIALRKEIIQRLVLKDEGFGSIKSIQRYLGLIMVRYAHTISFIDIASFKYIDLTQRIHHSSPIVTVEEDSTYTRFIYVVTAR